MTSKTGCNPCEEVENPCYTNEEVVSEFAPCYTDSVCIEGCEDSYNAKCVVIKVDLPHLGVFIGDTLESALLKMDTLLQELLPQLNQLIPAPVYNYHYKTECYSSVTVKRNGITLSSEDDYADKDLMLAALQSIDPLWEWENNTFKISSIHDWEITSSC